MVTYKKYRCKKCGYEKEIQTNHYGECYNWGRYNSCDNCIPFNKFPFSSTVWECREKPQLTEEKSS